MGPEVKGHRPSHLHCHGQSVCVAALGQIHHKPCLMTLTVVLRGLWVIQAVTEGDICIGEFRRTSSEIWEGFWEVSGPLFPLGFDFPASLNDLNAAQLSVSQLQLNEFMSSIKCVWWSTSPRNLNEPTLGRGQTLLKKSFPPFFFDALLKVCGWYHSCVAVWVHVVLIY